MEKVRDFEEESSHYGRTESKPLYLIKTKKNKIKPKQNLIFLF